MKTGIKRMIGLVLLMLAASVVSIASAAPAAPVMREFTPDSLQRIVADQKGKPFVLVVWSLDCVFCQTSLENLAAERRRGRDIRVVTLTTDYLGDEQLMEQSAKRLHALGFAGNAWAFGDESPERLRYALDPKWHGEKPRTYWFNAKGERTAYSGVVTAEQIGKRMGR